MLKSHSNTITQRFFSFCLRKMSRQQEVLCPQYLISIDRPHVVKAVAFITPAQSESARKYISGKQKSPCVDLI